MNIKTGMGYPNTLLLRFGEDKKPQTMKLQTSPMQAWEKRVNFGLRHSLEQFKNDQQDKPISLTLKLKKPMTDELKAAMQASGLKIVATIDSTLMTGRIMLSQLQSLAEQDNVLSIQGNIMEKKDF